MLLCSASTLVSTGGELKIARGAQQTEGWRTWQITSFGFLVTFALKTALGFGRTASSTSPFKKMVRGLSEQDRERTYHWTLKRQGRASCYAAVLENDAIGGAA